MARIKSKKYRGVYLNRLEDNDISYSIIYKDNQGKTCRVTIGKKSAGITEIYAFNKRNEIINKLRLGESPNLLSKKNRSIIPLDSIAEVFFKDKELHNKNIKLDHKRYINHLQKLFGELDVSSITEDDLIAFQKKKLKPSGSNKALSPKTVNNITAVLSAIINHAIKKRIYKGTNVVSQLKKLTIDNERERFLSTEDINLLLETIRENELLYLFCLLSLSTGARLDSVLLIKRKDVNLQTREITRIKDTKIKNPKKSIYKGFISNDLYEILKTKLPKLKPHEHIINIDNGRKMEGAQIRRRLHPIFDKLFNQGIDSKDTKNRVIIHTLRHTFASHLAINKTPIYTIMKLLNHQDIKSTLRYAKLAEDSGKDMVLELYKN